MRSPTWQHGEGLREGAAVEAVLLLCATEGARPQATAQATWLLGLASWLQGGPLSLALRLL